MNGRMRLACACLLAGAMAGAWGETAIYACVDGKGRHLTSDRPIRECLDREQRQLNPSGTTRRVLPPTPTAAERAAQEARERKLAEDRQREAEQKRMDKLLVQRYPNQALHDADRARALQAVEDVIATGRKHSAELQEERKKLATQTEFYKDASKYPPTLKRQLEDNEQQFAAQQRFIAAQEQEKQRIAQRFDTELAHLKELWAQRTASAQR